jgi:hypothetical protein
MEKITIEIETGNAAFDDAPATEIARILRNAAERIEGGDVDGFPLYDLNGNKCGALHITGEA